MGTQKRWALRILAAVAAFASLAAMAMAQVGDAELAGIVTDPSGTPVAAVKLSLTNEDSGVNRSVVTDAEGRYRIPALAPGKYSLKTEVPGFRSESINGILLNVGTHLDKDVALTMVRGFSYTAKKWFAFGAPLFSDEHGTGLQRYYNTLCIAYGADSVLFKDFVDKGDLPKERAANCASEYQQIKFAFEKTVLPFVDHDLMKKVQAKQWLKLSPAQVVALRQQQQKQQQTFSFAACNLSSISGVNLALAVRQVSDPQKWQVYGWFAIPDNGCNYIGTFGGEDLFWYAFSNTVAWTAPDTDRTASKQCIDKVHAFNEIAGAKCKPGQVAVNFRRWDVDPASTGVTLKLQD